MQTNRKIDNGQAFDWGRTSEDYARFRDIYPEEFYQKIIGLGLCVKGQRVLDLGTGTGVLPRNLYRYGATFTGVDLSENQIAQARRLSDEAGMQIRYLAVDANRLSFPDKSFDVITACQCFSYFDKTLLLPNVHRMLRPNGHFLILYMAWLPEESPIAKASEQLVLHYNPAWTGGGVKRYTLGTPAWSQPLFEVANALTFDLQLSFTRQSWHGRMKTCRGVEASLPREKVEQWEKEHLAYLSTVPEEFTIPHLATMLDLKRRDLYSLRHGR